MSLPRLLLAALFSVSNVLNWCAARALPEPWLTS